MSKASEEGASAVVAATLIFALAVMMFIVFSSTQLPIWIEDREQNHGLAVKESFTEFQSDLLQVTEEDVGVTKTLEVGLAPDPIAFLQTGRATAQLSILDDLDVDLQLTNGALYANGNTLSIQPTGALATWNNVESIKGLQMRMTATTADDAESTALVTFNDGTSQFTATFAHVGPDVGPCAGHALVVRLDVPAINKPLVCGIANSGSFDIDLFDEIPIQEALSNLNRPFTVTFSNTATSVTGSAIWYNEQGLPQNVGSVATGAVQYAESLGVIAYLPSFLDAVREDVRLEGGAVTIEQAAGGAMISPTLTLLTDTQTGQASLTFLKLTGAGSVSGDGTATIKITPTAVRNQLFHADQWSLTTAGTNAWGKSFTDELYLSEATGIVNEGQTSSITPNPLPNGWWIDLKIIEAKVELQ